MSNVARILTIGVPWDSYGREDAVDEAASRLRKRGLVDRLAMHHDFRDWGELVVPAFAAASADGVSPAQTEVGSLLGEEALLVVVQRLRDAVRYALEEDYTPFVFGGDAAIVLGCLAGVREAKGETGLVVVSGAGHAVPLSASPDGAAERSALALAVGRAGFVDGQPPVASAAAALVALIGDVAPLIRGEHLTLLGLRESQERAEHGADSLRDRLAGVGATEDEVGTHDVSGYVGGAELRTVGFADAAADAARRAAQPGRFWLHIDLDVLNQGVFAAADQLRAGGLSWPELVELTTTLRKYPTCCGVSLCGYNPQLDPDEIDARTIVEFVERLAAARRW
ncbi:MAG: arginase family protein [Thermoleophilia bacterium]